jgi:thioredoxin-related protein
MTPIVNGIKNDRGRQLNFVYACLDEQSGRDIAAQHGVVGYPLILLLDSQGNKVNTIRGVFPRVVIEKAIDELLAEE